MQENKLNAFYKEYLKKAEDEKLASNLITGIMLFCGIFVFLIPWQSIEAEGNEVGIWVWIMIMAVTFYTQRYRFCNEGKKQIKLSEKMRFFPISKKEIKKFHMRKIIQFCSVICCTCVVGQVIFALLFYHSLTWGNLLYPLYLTFLIPVALHGVVICLE